MQEKPPKFSKNDLHLLKIHLKKVKTCKQRFAKMFFDGFAEAAKPDFAFIYRKFIVLTFFDECAIIYFVLMPKLCLFEACSGQKEKMEEINS